MTQVKNRRAITLRLDPSRTTISSITPAQAHKRCQYPFHFQQPKEQRTDLPGADNSWRITPLSHRLFRKTVHISKTAFVFQVIFTVCPWFNVAAFQDMTSTGMSLI
jgi:hypothetical protein